MQKAMGARVDMDLDIMSLYEQELDAWKIIGSEGMRSEKSKKSREKAARVLAKRQEKEALRRASAANFDGKIADELLSLYRIASDSMGAPHEVEASTLAPESEGLPEKMLERIRRRLESSEGIRREMLKLCVEERKANAFFFAPYQL